MKRYLLLCLFIASSSMSYAQDKLNFIHRYCLLPFVEVGVGGVNINYSNYYGSEAHKFSTGGAQINAGFAKQVADLKLSVTVGYHAMALSANVLGSEEVQNGVTLNYFNANSIPLPSLVQDSLYSWTQFTSTFGFAQLNLNVEKRFANWYTIGAGLRNSILVRYIDEQELYYDEIVNGLPKATFANTTLKPEQRGVNTYQLMGTLFVGRQIRRPKLKMDWGLNTTISINSVTRKAPTSSFLNYYGFYTRFYIIPKVF